jgi:hypothetical protein
MKDDRRTQGLHFLEYRECHGTVKYVYAIV